MARAVEPANRAAVRSACGVSGEHGHTFADYPTIARFRQGHQEALVGLSAQRLRVCAELGLVRRGVLALGGTKIKANAAVLTNLRGAYLAAPGDWSQATVEARRENGLQPSIVAAESRKQHQAMRARPPPWGSTSRGINARDRMERTLLT